MSKLIIIVLCLFAIQSKAQNNNIHPNRVYCDSDYSVSGIVQNSDGSFLCSGVDFKGANIDGLVMKLDANYNVLWRKTYGGSENDRLIFIQKISADRFLVAGEATSIDGDLAPYSWPFITATNIWLMIVDSNGNFIRGSTYGYGSSTYLSGIQVRNDGNIFLSGETVAEGGDFAGNPGDPLVNQTFVALTDTMLNKKWLRYIKGLSSDYCLNWCNALDRNQNLVLSIVSTSTSGDYAGLGPVVGGLDAFLFCMDTSQNIVWRKRYEGNSTEHISDIFFDSSNHAILVANGNSTTGDFFTNEVRWNLATGISEYLTVCKTDSIGNILWKHAYGSFDTTMTELRNIQTDGLLVSGKAIWIYSRIQGRDSVGEGFGWTPQIGSVDTWIVQCDTLGIMENKLRLGGKQNDEALWISENSKSNNPVIGMLSVGSVGDITNFDCRVNKIADVKIFELEQWPNQVSDIQKSLHLMWTISPNPNDGNFLMTFEQEFSGDLKIYNSTGQYLFKSKLRNTLKKDLSIPNLKDGIYYFEISNKNGRQIKQLIIKH